MEQIRLNKYLAQCGICSRREADRLILKGEVLVNGQTPGIGQTICGTDQVTVRGKQIRDNGKKAVLAFYKPVGVVCTEKDPHAEKIINDMINYPVRVTYAGRLDKDSEGLILLTNDGDLIHAVTSGSSRHEKEYIVKVDKEVTNAFVCKMRDGIYLKELKIKTRECRIEKTGKYTFQITLTQGVNRQIRRMCKECGYRVKSLKRIRIMNIHLGVLKPGQYREITDGELAELYEGASQPDKTCGANAGE